MPSKISGSDLLASWQAAKERGLTQPEHARELGIKIGAYQNRMYRARADSAKPVPESRYPKWDKALEITGDALILCDLHIPYHEADFVNNCLRLATLWGIDQAVLAGDVIDAHAFSHWPEGASQEKKIINGDAEQTFLDLAAKMSSKDAALLRSALVDMTRDPSDMSEEIAESRKVLVPLLERFENIVWFMGNHEDRVIRVLEKSISVPDIAAMIGGNNPRIKFSAYYFCTLVSNGITFRVTHPKPAGKGVSKRLVPKFGQHIIMAHNHHFSIQSDASGQWLGIEPGMCADPLRMDYKRQRDDAADTNVVGAVLVRNGYPWLLNRWTDWKTMEKLR